MEKMIIVILSLFIVTGCSTIKWKTKVETQSVPILYCPKPNWDDIKQPSHLAIDSITDQTSAGEVAKRYKASIIQLQDYAHRLEAALQQYDSTNTAYEKLREEFKKQKLTENQ